MSIYTNAMLKASLLPPLATTPDDWTPGPLFVALLAEANRQAALLDESHRTPPNPVDQP